MDKIKAYRTWAPKDNIWSLWAKPVLFSNMAGANLVNILPNTLPSLDTSYRKDTLCIVDLEDVTSIIYGIALAHLGYQPIPLYNSVMHPSNMLVDVKNLQSALFHGAEVLETIPINESANPAFLLDSRRMGDTTKNKSGNYFDNRWSVFAQDMPSAFFLKEKGITRILVFSNNKRQFIKDDLSHILYAYQKEGIEIINGDTNRANTVKRPSMFKSAWYRILVVLGLKRNAAGGFGGRILEASSHNLTGGGRRYYGIG